MTTLRITDTATLIGSIPALLGFTPEHSIVAIALIDGRRLGPIIRHDIDTFDPATAHRIAAALTENGCDTAILVAVTDDDTRVRPALHHLEDLATALTAAGIRVTATYRTVGLTAGARWTDLRTRRVGTIPDPRDSELSAARAYDGLPIERTRTAIGDRFDLTTEIPMSVGFTAAARLGEEFLQVTLEGLAATLHAGEVPSDELVGSAHLALTGGTPDVRDSFLRLAVYGPIEAALLMTYTGNRVRGLARAHALTIAGFGYYLTGDGAAAGIAFDHAAAAATTAGQPVPRLTTLIDTALQRGTHPTRIRSILDAITAEYVDTATGAQLPN